MYCLAHMFCNAEYAVCIVWFPFFVKLKVLFVLSGSLFFVCVCDAEDAVCVLFGFQFL